MFEIKTHLTKLLSFDKGRKNFYWTSEAAKAITQAENYIYSLVANETKLIKRIRDEYGIQTAEIIRPTIYIIASMSSSLAGPQTNTKYKGEVKVKLMHDFRRLNNSLKDIRFVLYDELLRVFETMLKRLDELSQKAND